MKKNLLIILLINMFANGQTLLTENFNSLNVGNVGTDVTGVTAGQNNWYTSATASGNGTNEDFQINDYDFSEHQKTLKITGYSGAAATVPPSNSKFMWKNIATNWFNRDFGNDICEFEYEFYTGSSTTSLNNMRVTMYDSNPLTAATPKMLAGLMITMDVLSIRALAWYDPTSEGSTGAIGNYSIPLGSTGGATPTYSQITLLPNTWYKLGMSYNAATGELKFKEANGLITRTTIQGAAANSSVDNVQIIASTGGTAALPNTASATGEFDNIFIKATSTDTLLGINTSDFITKSISVSPNPASNFVTISSKENQINAISITDINGRTVKTVNSSFVSNLDVNVSDLTSGVYLMKITSENGVATKKFVKN